MPSRRRTVYLLHLQGPSQRLRRYRPDSLHDSATRVDGLSAVDALQRFKQAGAALAAALEREGVSTLAGYPSYLPSFDEFVSDLADVCVFDAQPPELGLDGRPAR